MEKQWTSASAPLPVFPSQQSTKLQWTLVFAFFVACFAFLFVLEARLAEQQKQLEFNYREYYMKPFHYKLDPFTYLELKDGVPITEPEPPNPHFVFSFEEMLVNRFVDYYFWSRGPTDETDVTVDADRMPKTIAAFGGHLRNRIYYRLESGEEPYLDDMNPIILEPPAVANNQSERVKEPNKLVWNTIPYCTDPILEEALHELGNVHGFLYSRGNHNNYRFLDQRDSETMTSIIATVPLKLAYLYDHNYLNFTRHGWKDPVRVSIVCDPIQRKLRHFYTERYNYRHWQGDFAIASPKANWWKMSLEDCMKAKDGRECGYAGVKSIKKRHALDIGRTWLPRRVEWMLPQFCDYDRCEDLGVRADWADYVSQSLENDYEVVGTLERIDDTMDLLEANIPQFFKGIKAIYYKLKAEEASRAERKFGPRIPTVSQDVLAEMRRRYGYELQLYQKVDRLIDARLKEAHQF